MSDDDPRAPRIGVMILAHNAHVEGPGLRCAGSVELDSRLFAPGEVDRKGDVLGQEPSRIELGPAGRDQRRRNGRELLEEVRRACEHDRSRLRVLIALFPWIVLRVPEVHALLDSLPSREAQILLGERRGPGRPPEPHAHLARARSMGRLVEAHGVPTADAARMLAAAGAHAGEERLRNLASEGYQRFARFLVEGLLVPEGELVPLEWGASEQTTVTVYVSEQEEA